MMTKEEFTDRILFDRSNDSKLPPRKKKKRKASVLPFKEGTYLDIINLLREKYGEDIRVKKENDVTIYYNGEIYNIKVITKRARVS